MDRFSIAKFSLIPLVLLVFTLAWQNRQLQQENSVLSANMTAPYIRMWVPEINIETLDGDRVAVGKPQKNYQILFFFSPVCRYCYESLPAISHLVERVDDTIRIIGISNANLKETSAYVKQHKLEFSVAALADIRTLSLFRARVVPLILIIDNSGRVKHYHRGVLSTQDDVDAILAAVQSYDVKNKDVKNIADI